LPFPDFLLLYRRSESLKKSLVRFFASNDFQNDILTQVYYSSQMGYNLRTTKLITISLPPELLGKIEKLSRKENRTRSEFLRETVRQYLAREEWLN
jgi:hypothetical protein